MYRYPMQNLRDEFHCIAVDLAGLGLSEARLLPGKAFAQNTNWLRAIVQALGLCDVTLIVHATAGPSVLETAARERQRIGASVISNSFAWPLDHPQVRRFAQIVSSSLFGFVNTRTNLLPRQNYLFGLRVERQMLQNIAPRLEVFRQTPTLSLYGAPDTGFKAGFLDKWKKLQTNDRTVVLLHSRHFPLEDEPDRYTAGLEC